jgi:nitroimidazol reductase NimA-like FMN-containing flavoprotein (pyridoxamine 5'-phosphate oxidase superfamily)
MEERPSERITEELSVDECLELLSSATVGRIAVAGPDGPPLVVPVNFVLDGDVVVFRTSPGTKLEALRRHRASFQADWIDPLHRTGWSVLVQGLAFEGSAPDVDLEPWEAGPKRYWIRLVPSAITGRRLSLPSVELDGRGYR